MADVGDEKQGEEAAEDSKSGKGLLKRRSVVIGTIIATQVLVVMLIGEKLIKPRLVREPVEVQQEVREPEERGFILMLNNIIVNLNGAEASRYLKISIGLEVDNEDASAEIEERMPQLRDIVISSTCGRMVEELVSVEGKELLKKELRARMSRTIQEGKLMNVYFSEFVVQ